MIKIVTDSTAYLSKDIVEELGISVVPLSVNYGDEHFEEGQKYSNQDFFKMLNENKHLFPTTSQPAAGKFLETYQRIAAPKDDIISIHLSGNISGTVQSAETAAKMLPDYNVTVIDSLSTVAGLGCMVTEAARLANQGCTKSEIILAINHIKENLKTLFMVDSFEYLKRGGRIGGAQALLGTVLQIKPILFIRGSIDVFGKIRTRQKALETIINELGSFLQSNQDTSVKVYVLNVHAEQEANDFRTMILNKFPNIRLENGEIGPVIGCHVGPGTLGIAFTSLLPGSNK